MSIINEEDEVEHRYYRQFANKNGDLPYFCVQLTPEEQDDSDKWITENTPFNDLYRRRGRSVDVQALADTIIVVAKGETIYLRDIWTL